MPYYYKKKVAHFEVEPKPRCCLRNFFPYFVGKQVRFDLTITNKRKIVDATTLYMFESINGKERYVAKYTKTELAEKHKATYIGDQITDHGRLKYIIGTSSSPYKGQETIFSCRPIDARDSIVWLIVTAIISSIISIMATKNWGLIINALSEGR